MHNSSKRHGVLSVLAWVAAVALIVILSLLPTSSLFYRIVPSALLSAGHVPAYALLAGVSVVLLRRWGVRRREAALLTVVGALFLGGAMELGQSGIGRTSQFADVGMDLIGIVLGLLAANVLSGSRRGRSES